jgi:hypothetical protein
MLFRLPVSQMGFEGCSLRHTHTHTHTDRQTEKPSSASLSVWGNCSNAVSHTHTHTYTQTLALPFLTSLSEYCLAYLPFDAHTNTHTHTQTHTHLFLRLLRALCLFPPHTLEPLRGLLFTLHDVCVYVSVCLCGCMSLETMKEIVECLVCVYMCVFQRSERGVGGWRKVVLKRIERVCVDRNTHTHTHTHTHKGEEEEERKRVLELFQHYRYVPSSRVF